MSERKTPEEHFQDLVRLGQEARDLEGFVVNDLTWHELIHGASIAEHTLNTVLGYLGARALLAQEPEVAEAAQLATDALQDFYQTVATLAPHMNAGPPAPSCQEDRS